MHTSTDIANLSAALVAVAAEIGNPKATGRARVKTKTGRDYEYEYLELDEVLAIVRPLLASHSLVLTQEARSVADGRSAVVTRLSHAGGEWLETEALALPSGEDPQAHGSAITYARRYQLLAVLGIAAGDDDAVAAKPRQAPGPSDEGREGRSDDAPAETPTAGTGESGGTPPVPPSGDVSVEALIEFAGSRQKAVAALNRSLELTGKETLKVGDLDENTTPEQRAVAYAFIQEKVREAL